uniref:Phage Tail Collar Domain n=1 Tax=Candidatus Kentrum sp. LFY TaxID=2126342 RepID=A0A450UGJ6_9GAMM|nr:MAG: hypothetical protein BECKLFY1418B_GA0070995_102718 [Candidatus Kentron sp. LFY]
MKKHSLLLPILLFILPALSFATTPLDYCERQLEQDLKDTYSVETLDEYRGHLREVLRHSRKTLRDYVDADDGSVPVPLPIVRDILSAEEDNRSTKEFIDNLRTKYSPSPQLALRAEDFDAFASKVLDSATVADWDRCKTTCSECLANASGRQNGISYRILGDRKGIFSITFTYLPERKTDPNYITVSKVTVTGSGVLNEPLKIRRNKILHRYNRTTQTFRRVDPKTDVAIRIDFKGREGLQLLVSDRRPEAGLPVGTVLSSILPWEEYARVANDTLPYDPRLNYWAPCDGRDIKGSRLQERTNHAKAPDLRGVFLRGLNKFDLDESESKAVSGKQRDPGPRDADGFQGDNPGAHDHVYYGDRAHDKSAIDYVHVQHTENGVWYSGDYQQTKERPTGKNPTGETRPKNVAVHYYIKIN